VWHRQDTVPLTKARHPCANLIHDARNFIADDAREFGSIGIKAHAGQKVREVDSSGADADSHSTRSGHRVRGLADF
jgi:hypothetical protein